MSYCVNCGVELDKTCSVCPLCNTKVINPNQPVDTVSPKPYPVDKGYVDSGIRKETAILMAVCLAATAVVCGLLNLFFITFSHWSFYVIGTCIVLWIFCLPIFFPTKAVFRITLLLDGLGHRHVLRHHCLAPSRQRLVHSYRPAPDYSGHTGSFLLRHQYGPSEKLYTFPGCHPRGRNRHLLCLCRTADAPLLRRANGSFLVRHCPHLRYYHRRDTGDYPAAKPVEGGSPEKDAYIKIRTYNYAFKNAKKQS